MGLFWLCYITDKTEMKDSVQTHFFDYSYITNFLADFMKALIYVHGEWKQIRQILKWKSHS